MIDEISQRVDKTSSFASPIVIAATKLLNQCQKNFCVKRADLYIDDSNMYKWTVTVWDRKGVILPFLRRFRIAIRNIFIYKLLKKEVPPYIDLRIGFTKPSNSNGRYFLQSYDSILSAQRDWK